MFKSTIRIPKLSQLEGDSVHFLKSKYRILREHFPREVIHDRNLSDEQLQEVISLEARQKGVRDVNAYIITQRAIDKCTTGYFGITTYVPLKVKRL